MKVGIKALLLGLMMTSQTLYAVEVERLFEAEIIAESELEQDRNTAIKKALSVVLGRILAGNEVLQNDTVKKVLADALHYVNEFQYSLISNDVKNNTRLMRVYFDEKLLTDVFHTSELGLWNEIRSRTLVWLVLEKEQKKQFFDASLMPEIDAAINNAAKVKALPFLYPIQDLKEKKSLSISDVLSAYSDRLIETSKRYDVVSTLAGKLVHEENCWKAEWTLYFDDKIKQWRSQCGLIDEVALNGFQGVYDILSKYYAVKPRNQAINSVNLKISNIHDESELARVTHYLDELSMAKTVTWIGEETGYNIFRIFYQGTRHALINELAKDRMIRAENFELQNGDIVNYKLLVEIF